MDTTSLFDSLETILKDQVAMVQAGIDSEQATEVVFDRVEGDNEVDTRHKQLIDLGFELLEVKGYRGKHYEHNCGMWIADYALDQYDEIEWQHFLSETDTAINQFQ